MQGSNCPRRELVRLSKSRRRQIHKIDYAQKLSIDDAQWLLAVTTKWVKQEEWRQRQDTLNAKCKVGDYPTLASQFPSAETLLLYKEWLGRPRAYQSKGVV